MPVWEPRGQPYAAPGEIQQQSSPVHHHHSSAVSAADPHAGRFYPQIHAPAGFSTPPHAAGLSTHQQGSSFVTGTPAYSAPPHAAAGLHTQGSFVTADCYSYVDQVGNLQTAPVVSRHDVLNELRLKHPSATISGSEMASGADASPHHRASAASSRGQQRRSSSASAAARASSAAGPPRDSVLRQWLVPDEHVRYWALWTSLFTVAASFVFAFMAGNYGVYTQSPTFSAYNKGSSLPVQLQWGPQALLGWLKFWESSPLNSFDVGFMMNWGARYMPAIAAGEWWRLMSSICLHGSFGHLFSNLLVFVILAVPLEHTYGPFRIFLIFVASGFGGTFLSMAFEDPCFVYVGASGAVFGFIGLYLADIILNFESMYKPLLRLALMLLSLGLTLGIEFAAAARNPLQRVSHMSHVGGLAAGLTVSFLFIPNLADRRWKSARKLAARVSTSLHARWSHNGSTSVASTTSSAAAGLPHAMPQHEQSCWRRNAWLYYVVWLLSACVILFLFAALPVYVYKVRMPALACPSLMPQASG